MKRAFILLTVLAATGSWAIAFDVPASGGWECDRMPSAAGWDPGPEGKNLEELMTIVTTPDGESAATWGPYTTDWHRITMDPANIPGLPNGGADDMTIEVRVIGTPFSTWYQGHIFFHTGLAGGAEWQNYIVGTHSGWQCTKGAVRDGNNAQVIPWLYNENAWVLTRPPSAEEDVWVTMRQVQDWFDHDADGNEDDVHLRWLINTKEQAGDGWFVVADAIIDDFVAVGDGTATDLERRWFGSNGNTAAVTCWVDYIRWVDEALEDGDKLTPAVSIGDCNPGDANGDGVVNLLDLDVLGQNYGVTTGAECTDGDFDADGDVDLVDLDTLGRNYGETYPGGVPEPATMGLLALGGLALLRRRR